MESKIIYKTYICDIDTSEVCFTIEDTLLKTEDITSFEINGVNYGKAISSKITCSQYGSTEYTKVISKTIFVKKFQKVFLK